MFNNPTKKIFFLRCLKLINKRSKEIICQKKNQYAPYPDVNDRKQRKKQVFKWGKAFLQEKKNARERVEEEGTWG